MGGTSAVAPLWAALISRLAEATGQRFGLVQTLLYAGVTPGAAVRRLPRHHQREQRGLHGRPRLGRLLGPGQSRRYRPADPAPGLTPAAGVRSAGRARRSPASTGSSAVIRVPAPAWLEMLIVPPDASNAVGQPDEPGAAGRIGSADAVVADRHGQSAVPHLDLDLHHGCPRVLGHVGQGFADYEVSSHLGPFGQPGLHPYVEFHRHRGPAGQRLQRRGRARPATRWRDGCRGTSPAVPPVSRRYRWPGGPVPVAARAVRAARLSARRAGRARVIPAVAGPRRAGRARSGVWLGRSLPRSAPGRRRDPPGPGQRPRSCRSCRPAAEPRCPRRRRRPRGGPAGCR